jgi:hypothetical protein
LFCFVFKYKVQIIIPTKMTTIGGRIQKKKRETPNDELDIAEDPPKLVIGTTQISLNEVNTSKLPNSERSLRQSDTKISAAKGARNTSTKNQTITTSNKIIPNISVGKAIQVKSSTSNKSTPAPSQSPYTPNAPDSNTLTPDPLANTTNSSLKSSTVITTTNTSSRIAKISSGNSSSSSNRMTGEPSWVKPLHEEVLKNEVSIITYSKNDRVIG